MAGDIETPATEIEIAAAIRRCSQIDELTIRRLAFERDMLRSRVHEKSYDEGYRDGLEAYAHWQNGTQYVGSCGTTLVAAIERRKTNWNYRA